MKKILIIISLVTVLALTACVKEYTISYETNGGTEVADQTVVENDLVQEPSNIVKEGYELDGWYLDAEFTNGYSFPFEAYADTKLYAKWTAIDYTLDFDSDGLVELEDVTFNIGDYYSFNDVTVEGYDFLGWYLEDDTKLSSAGIVLGMNDLTIYIKFEAKTYTLSFESSGLIVLEDVEVTYLEEYTLPLLTVEGYDFLGWLDEDGDPINGDTFTMPASDYTLYPSFKKQTVEGAYVIALITDMGSIDDGSYNQMVWEGIQRFGEEFNYAYKYYQPLEQNTEAFVNAIDLAVEEGAEIVIMPNWFFENAAYIAQYQHPNINFLLLDGVPHNVVDWNNMQTVDGKEVVYSSEDNTVSALFIEAEAGFLAGYAAVKEGYTELGFIGGMAVPAVVKYGSGFIQGANYAATEMGLANDAITINYAYAGAFWANASTQATAQSWYQEGTEVIFAVAGGAGSSIMAAAAIEDGKVIGVDVDQSGYSDTIITSAIKRLDNVVYITLQQHFAGTFIGGNFGFGATDNAVGLPQDFSRFTTFDETMYTQIFDKLQDGTIWVDSESGYSMDGFIDTYDKVILVKK